jgi:hypothetical protein
MKIYDEKRIFSPDPQTPLGAAAAPLAAAGASAVIFKVKWKNKTMRSVWERHIYLLVKINGTPKHGTPEQHHSGTRVTGPLKILNYSLGHLCPGKYRFWHPFFSNC